MYQVPVTVIEPLDPAFVPRDDLLKHERGGDCDATTSTTEDLLQEHPTLVRFLKDITPSDSNIEHENSFFKEQLTKSQQEYAQIVQKLRDTEIELNSYKISYESEKCIVEKNYQRALKVVRTKTQTVTRLTNLLENSHRDHARQMDILKNNFVAELSKMSRVMTSLHQKNMQLLTSKYLQ